MPESSRSQASAPLRIITVCMYYCYNFYVKSSVHLPHSPVSRLHGSPSRHVWPSSSNSRPQRPSDWNCDLFRAKSFSSTRIPTAPKANAVARTDQNPKNATSKTPHHQTKAENNHPTFHLATITQTRPPSSSPPQTPPHSPPSPPPPSTSPPHSPPTPYPTTPPHPPPPSTPQPPSSNPQP